MQSRSLSSDALPGVELVINALPGHQAIVGAGFHYLAVVQDYDLAHISDCGETMGNYDGGSVLA